MGGWGRARRLALLYIAFFCFDLILLWMRLRRALVMLSAGSALLVRCACFALLCAGFALASLPRPCCLAFRCVALLARAKEIV